MPPHDHLLLPTTPAQISPAFLTILFQKTGVLRLSSVKMVQEEPIGVEGSFNAQLARLHLQYDSAEPGAPQTLIAKLPTVKPELQQNALVFRPGEKECWFYQHGSARASLSIPRCYFSAVDPKTGQSFLLLEDLAPAKVIDWVSGISFEEAEHALQAVARLHAAWWNIDPTTNVDLASLVDNNQEEQSMVDHLYQQGWPRFLERVPFEVPGEVCQFGNRLVGRIREAEALLDQSPKTLIHGDFRPGNILYGTRNGESTCWIIDWEDITPWNGMFDAAWLLGGGLRVGESAAEERLLQHYYHALVSEGVKGYAWEQCHYDYRRAMVSSFVQGVLTVASVETNDQTYAYNLIHTLGERFVDSCRRLRLDELMPSS